MVTGSYIHFKGTNDYGESLLKEQIAVNVSEWMKFAFLNIGAFTNVTIGSSGAYGGEPARLRPVNIPGRTDGRTWQSHRKDWVWESGIEYHTQPIHISGVFVNGVFQQPTGQYYVDYPNGQVVFNSALPLTSRVELNYSVRAVYVYDANTTWFKEIQVDSQRVDNPQFTQVGSGVWNILAKNRVQLPAIVVEPIENTSYKGMQIGGGQYVYSDVVFHVLAETPSERNNIVDTIGYQNEKTILMYDINSVNRSNGWPLKLNGSLASGAKTYPQMLEVPENGGYEWAGRRCRFMGMGTSCLPPVGNVYIGVAKCACEVGMPEI